MKRLLLKGALVALFSFGATAALAGPACTFAYPRGYQVPKATKKNPLHMCVSGVFTSTWGPCVSRYNIQLEPND
jgi:hypothetical protein